MKVDLVSMEVLRPHEETIPKKVDELEKMTHRQSNPFGFNFELVLINILLS